MNITRSEHRLQLSDWSLAIEGLTPPSAPHGVVVMGHAMMCNRRSLDRPKGEGFASLLAERGFQVYTFDVRGHGESGPGATRKKGWSYWDIVSKDLPGVISWAKERHPSLPLAFLGHSLTGHAAVLHLGDTPDSPVDALVVLGANFWMRRFDSNPWRWKFKVSLLLGWFALSKARGHFPTRALRMGSDDTSTEFVKTVLSWAMKGTCLNPEGRDLFANLGEMQTPTLGVFGGKDKLLCNEESGGGLLDMLPKHERLVIPQATHIGLVIDPQGRWAWSAIADWLFEQLSLAADKRVGDTASLGFFA